MDIVTHPPAGTDDGGSEPRPARVALANGDVAAAEAREIMLANQHFVERADTKASILLAAISAGIVAMITSMFQTMDWAAQGGIGRTLVEVMLALALLSLILAAFQAGRVILPRLGNDTPAPDRLSPGDLVYFGRLRSMTPSAVASGIRDAVAHGTLVDHYAAQIHVNAALAWAKHRQLLRSIHLLLPAGAFALAGLLTWLTMRLLD